MPTCNKLVGFRLTRILTDYTWSKTSRALIGTNVYTITRIPVSTSFMICTGKKWPRSFSPSIYRFGIPVLLHFFPLQSDLYDELYTYSYTHIYLHQMYISSCVSQFQRIYDLWALVKSGLVRSPDLPIDLWIDPSIKLLHFFPPKAIYTINYILIHTHTHTHTPILTKYTYHHAYPSFKAIYDLQG